MISKILLILNSFHVFFNVSFITKMGIKKSKLPLLTGQKLRNVAMDFPINTLSKHMLAKGPYPLGNSVAERLVAGRQPSPGDQSAVKYQTNDSTIISILLYMQ